MAAWPLRTWAPLILDEVRDHYLAAFGPPTGSDAIRRDGVDIEICRWPAPPGYPGTLVATLGGAAVISPPPFESHRLEFYALLSPSLPLIGHVLADLATYPLSERAGLGDSHTVDFQRPLSDLNGMHHVLLIRPNDDFLPSLTSTVSDVHVEFLEVIPVFESEVVFKKKHGVGVLFETWEGRDVPFWNPGRPEIDLG